MNDCPGSTDRLFHSIPQALFIVLFVSFLISKTYRSLGNLSLKPITRTTTVLSICLPAAIALLEHSMSTLESTGLSGVHLSDRTGPPDLRLIHYNDVYHVEYQPLSLEQQELTPPADRYSSDLDPRNPLAGYLDSSRW